ncbi:YidH family protein (plasmid) [Cupriavidus basilensis]
MREPRWRRDGTEPDYRFSLANERTFLAWIRTGLGLLAGGILLDQFSTRLGQHTVIVALAIALSFLAALLCAVAYVRWRANEIAMRHARRLPGTMAIPSIAASLCCIGAVVAFLLFHR